MALPVEVVVSELHAAAARLREAGQRLQDGLSSVDLETRELLGSGWKGDAASAFGKEWEKWHGGAGQVVRGLQTMSDLLTVAGKEYAKTDSQAADALGSTMQGSAGSGGGTPASGAGGEGMSPSATGQGASGQGGTGDLAQQMNLGQSMMAPVSQIGQMAAGLAQQAGQAVAGAAQAASGMAQQAAQIRPADDRTSGGKDEAVTRDAERQSAQRPEDHSHDSDKHDGETERPSDGAGSGGRSGSTAPVEPLPRAPEPPSEGGQTSTRSERPAD